MHAQERCRRSFDRPQLLLVSLELDRRQQVRCQRPVKDCDDNGSGQLDGRLLDREHHPAVLTAIAVVLLVARSTRGSVRVGIGNGSGRVFVVRGVVVRRTVGVNMSHGRRLTACSRSFAGGTRAEPGVEVAAAERHGDHQEEGHQKPEWTAAMEHTSPEYIGEHGTALRTSGFGIPRHGDRMTVDRSSSGNNPPDQMPGADTRQGSGAQESPNSCDSETAVGILRELKDFRGLNPSTRVRLTSRNCHPMSCGDDSGGREPRENGGFRSQSAGLAKTDRARILCKRLLGGSFATTASEKPFVGVVDTEFSTAPGNPEPSWFTAQHRHVQVPPSAVSPTNPGLLRRPAPLPPRSRFGPPRGVPMWTPGLLDRDPHRTSPTLELCG